MDKHKQNKKFEGLSSNFPVFKSQEFSTRELQTRMFIIFLKFKELSDMVTTYFDPALLLKSIKRPEHRKEFMFEI